MLLSSVSVSMTCLVWRTWMWEQVHGNYLTNISMISPQQPVSILCWRQCARLMRCSVILWCRRLITAWSRLYPLPMPPSTSGDQKYVPLHTVYLCKISDMQYFTEPVALSMLDICLVQMHTALLSNCSKCSMTCLYGTDSSCHPLSSVSFIMLQSVIEQT